MEMIPVIYSRSRTVGSLVIRLVDKGPVKCMFSHVGIISECGNYAYEAVAGDGVVRTPMWQFKRRSSSWQLGWFPTECLETAYSRVKAQVGKRYDYKAVAGLALSVIGRKWDSPDKWFCSELLSYASSMFEDSFVNAIGVAYCYTLTRRKQKINICTR